MIEPLTIGNKGSWGGNARDTCPFIKALFWILRTGAPWRDLPPECGDWKNTHRRFCRRRDKRIRERILEALIEEPDFEWLMTDAGHIKVHPHATGAVCGNQDMERTKGGSTPRYIWPWVDAHGMPERFFVTAGTAADCAVAAQLIEGFAAQYLLADRGHDTNEIIAFAQASGMEAIIPSKKNRKAQRDYDRYLYKLRHLGGNAFLHLKRWRGIATRYAKNTASFVAAVQIRCIAIWSAIY